MIDLYTARTPNGFKATIALEELGLDYTIHPIDLGALDQKQDWFLKINPNGRIPALIDRANDDFAVFESGAILLYLAEKTGKLIPADPKKASQVVQWLMFQMAGLGPMQGQAHVFTRYFDDHLPKVIDRYQKETRRLYEVLDGQLVGQDFLVGDYSIADIAAWPWVRSHDWAGVAIDDLAHLSAWFQRIDERPAVQVGLKQPPKVETEDKVTSAQKMLV